MIGSGYQTTGGNFIVAWSYPDANTHSYWNFGVANSGSTTATFTGWITCAFG